MARKPVSIQTGTLNRDLWLAQPTGGEVKIPQGTRVIVESRSTSGLAIWAPQSWAWTLVHVDAGAVTLLPVISVHPAA